MNTFQINLPLPQKQKELLLQLASESRQRNVLSVGYHIEKHEKPPYDLTFTVGAEEIQAELMEDPIPGFEVLGLVKKTDEHTLFLTPNLYEWADYEHKSGFMKWVYRNPNIARDVLLAISVLLSLTLLILKITQP
jgi:hypothetical protein